MTHYSLKRDLKKFKEKKEASVLKELLQLHMKDAFAPQYANTLSR
jgi:hypothetical protein